MSDPAETQSCSTDRRSFLVAASALLASGCFGSFAATNALYDWNTEVSDSKWLRWLVFLVLIILPVYGLFILADALVLNTIEFFSGKNPIGNADLGDGHKLRSSRTAHPELVKHEIYKEDELVRTLYVRRVSERELQLLDEHMRIAGRARILPDGSVQVLDAKGRTVSTIPPEQVQRAEAALQSGASPSRAVAEAIEARADQRILASAG